MKHKTKVVLALLALSLIVPASAAKKKSAKDMKAEMDAMMAQMVKFGTPGENHKMLESQSGKWNNNVKMWMKEGDKPQESKGTSEMAMIHGGRFLKQDYKGDMSGMPFEGTGYTGYDNISGQFESIWMDNMMTSIMKTTGMYDPATKTITFTGTMSCPMTGDKERPVKAEWKFIDADNSVYSSYDKTPEGKEFKAMEITYTRAK
jgi:hypothetical protein